MLYMSVGQAAEKWGVTTRRVYQYCEEGRIDGLLRCGKAWVIPAATDKPVDPRRAYRTDDNNNSPFYPFLLVTSIMPVCEGKVQQVLSGTVDEQKRILVEHELAYFRGNHIKSQQCGEAIDKNSPARLCALYMTMISSLCLGNSDVFHNAEDELLALKKKYARCKPAIRMIELAQTAVKMYIYTPYKLPEWFEKGDMSALPVYSREFAYYIYVKYLQSRGEYEKLLTVAKTVLSIGSRGSFFTSNDVFLLLYCALGCIKTNDMESAKNYYRRAMKMALPDGFIMPFAECITTMQGLSEKCFAKEYSSVLSDVINLWKGTWNNRVSAHNERLKANATTILTRREYQVALFAADGLTNARIAENMKLSVPTVKSHMLSIFSKLYINKRSQIKDFVI